PTVTSEQRTIEFNYGARVLYRWSPRIQPGVEFFGDIGRIRDTDPSQEQEHYVSPMIYARLASGIYASGGLMFGLTRASDPVLIRFALDSGFPLCRRRRDLFRLEPRPRPLTPAGAMPRRAPRAAADRGSASTSCRRRNSGRSCSCRRGRTPPPSPSTAAEPI